VRAVTARNIFEKPEKLAGFHIIQGRAVYRKLVTLSVSVRAKSKAIGLAIPSGIHWRGSIGADCIE